ncbi:MAG: hypothetical protein ABDH28_07580 [Brevinematia bacterium]
MHFLKKEEIKSYTTLSPFVIFSNNTYYGVFIKKDGKVKNLGPLISLPESYLPEEFKKNHKFIKEVIEFKRRKASSLTYLKVSLNNSTLTFDAIFHRKTIARLSFKKDIGTLPKAFDNTSTKEMFYNNLPSIVVTIIPSKLLKLLSNAKVLYLETDEESSRIPFELIAYKMDILVKRVIGINKEKLAKNYIKSALLIGNGWDKRFKLCASEAVELYNIVKDRFSSEIICDSMKIEEFAKKIQEKDILFISSHAEENGISLGEDIINADNTKFIPKFPNIVFLNNCYYFGIEEFVREILQKGSSTVIFSPFKVPESHQTKTFTHAFFETLAKSYDLDLSLFTAMKVSKAKKHYNYLLYRFCI